MPLQLWIAYPDDLLNESAVTQCAAILNQEDHMRWQRFKFGLHRRESLSTRALVRNALSHGRLVPPQAWCFTTNQYGKPAVDPDCGLRFNASNSVGLVVCLTTESAEVGVDVEPLTRAREILRLAPEVFSTVERAQLGALALDKRLDRAVTLWTLKEAYIKAYGLGLAIPLDKFSFLFESERDIHLEIDHTIKDQAERWRFFLLNHAGHRIAAVIERSSAGDLQLFEARPAAAPPVLLNGFTSDWRPCEQPRSSDIPVWTDARAEAALAEVPQLER